jgi:hypothetical protein
VLEQQFDELRQPALLIRAQVKVNVPAEVVPAKFLRLRQIE